MKLIFCSLLFVVASVSVGVAQGTYTAIDVPGAVATEPHGISTEGQVIGSYQDAMGRWHAFLSDYAGASFETIDAPGAIDTYALGLNDFDQMVGTSSDGRGFVYNMGTRHFDTVFFPGSTFTVPTCISNLGTIAGYFQHFGLYEGFQLTGSSYSKIVAPGATTTIPTGITYNDTIVGTANIMRASTNVNFVFYHGQFNPLMIPALSQPGVSGVAQNGIAIVGNYQPSTGVSTGFMWNSITLQTFMFPGAIETEATGINASTIVIGYFLDANKKQRGFSWHP